MNFHLIPIITGSMSQALCTDFILSVVAVGSILTDHTLALSPDLTLLTLPKVE